MTPKGAKPSDGYSYSPIELVGLMHLPVTEQDILDGLERRWRWFRHSGDKRSASIVLQSLIADMDDLERAKARETK
jgi:hypothetical protein